MSPEMLHPLTDQEIRALVALDLSDCPSEELARDTFFVSMSCCGISFAQVAALTPDCIRGKCLCFDLPRTGNTVRVQLTPHLARIFERHWDPERGTLMPAGRLALRRVAALAGIDKPLTASTAKATWAALALRMRLPLDVVSVCLGHSSQRATRAYLDSVGACFAKTSVTIQPIGLAQGR